MRDSIVGAWIFSAALLAFAACSTDPFGAADGGDEPPGLPGGTGGSGGGAGTGGGFGSDKESLGGAYAVNDAVPAGGSNLFEFEPPAECEGVEFALANTVGFRQPSSQSNGSAVLAEALLAASKAPPAFSIRPQDFVWQYVRSTPTDSVQIVPDLLVEDKGAKWLLQVAVQAPSAFLREPTAITFAVDTSPSMEGASLALSKAVLSAITSQLVMGDTVNIVTGTGVLQQNFTAGNTAELAQVISQLAPENNADMASLIGTGADLATEQPAPAGGSYLVLLTDGSESLPADALGQLSAFGDSGELHFIGVGIGDPVVYEPGLLHQLTSATDAQRYFVGSDADAVATFGEGRFGEVFGTFGYDPRIELTVPDYLELDEETEFAEQTGSISMSRRWAFGEMLVVRQNLSACAEGLPKLLSEYAITHPQESPPTSITITVRYNDVFGNPQPPISGSVSILPDGPAVSAENQRLGQMRAALTFADALSAPTPARLQAAGVTFEKMEMQGIQLGQLPMLLERHPAFVAP